MSFEKDFIAYMLTVTSITDLVGNRIYPLNVRQETEMPAISVQRITVVPVEHQGGQATVMKSLFQVNSWGANYQESKDLAETIRLALDAYSGTMGGETARIVRFLDEGDDFQPETEEVRTTQEYEVVHTE